MHSELSDDDVPGLPHDPFLDHFSPDQSDSDARYLLPHFDEDEGTLAETDHLPRPKLRSRPPINFSGRSTPGSDFNYSATAFSQSHSQRLGPTSHSSLKPSNPFPRKISDVLPRLPPAVIAALTVSELYHNPHYRELRHEYDRLSGIIEVYRDFVSPPAAINNNVFQSAWYPS
jgi:hypothetical protein